MSRIRIALDRGHGGPDPGAVCGAVRERELNTALTKELLRLLDQDGRFETMLCCPFDENASVDDRAAAANSFGAIVLVSNHFNAGKGCGCEVYAEIRRDPDDERYQLYLDSTRLAGLICRNMAAFTKTRGVKQRLNSAGNASYFGIIRNAKMPCVIVENAFIDNPDDIAPFIGGNGIKAAAEAQYKALLEYFDLESKSAVHWAQKHYDSLLNKGVEIHETRFDDAGTRGELFALLDRIVK